MNNAEKNSMAFDIEATVQSMRAEGDQFAIATVVRTISVTAAKPGAKAIINSSGEIVEGWIGGGCAKGAVIKAAVQALSDGEPRLVSLQPEEFLKENGLTAGEDVDGVMAARNMCPSRGSMDIFVEPILCEPALLILGVSPVARMLASLAEPFAFKVSWACAEPGKVTAGANELMNFDDLPEIHDHRYIVVATQGSGDAAALEKALTLKSRLVSFVGSRRKTQHLQEKLRDRGFSDEEVSAIKGPAGLDIGGITPQEIALSILAELVAYRRTQSIPVFKQ